MRPAGKRVVVSHLVQAHRLSQRRACRLAELNFSTWQYRARRKEQAGLRERIKELAGERRRFGYRRLHALLRREGWGVNHKAVHRLYVEEGLQVRKRKRKRVARCERQPMVVPQAPNRRWSMDFQHDLLATGQRFRSLNIVDDFSRECPAIEVDTSLPGTRGLFNGRTLPTALPVGPKAFRSSGNPPSIRRKRSATMTAAREAQSGQGVPIFRVWRTPLRRAFSLGNTLQRHCGNRRKVTKNLAWLRANLVNHALDAICHHRAANDLKAPTRPRDDL